MKDAAVHFKLSLSGRKGLGDNGPQGCRFALKHATFAHCTAAELLFAALGGVVKWPLQDLMVTPASVRHSERKE